MPVLGHYTNSADPVQMPQNAASDQDQHCLLTGISTENAAEVKKTSTKEHKTRNGLIQMSPMQYYNVKPKCSILWTTMVTIFCVPMF